MIPTSSARVIDPRAPQVQPLLLCTFSVGQRRYGIDALAVREINTETQISKVPHAPPDVYGLVNVRGQIFLIFDLGQVFCGATTADPTRSRLILLKSSVGPACGVLVDDVHEIVSVDPSELLPFASDPGASPAGAGADPRARICSDLLQLPQHLVVVVDPRRLVQGAHRDA
jgi:purine-binding chemotaxis protein CheW